MGKYLIRVESMDGQDAELDERYVNGIEADGFAIIADQEDSASVAIHHMSIDDIAASMMEDKNLLCAAIVAKARNEVLGVKRREHKGDFMRDLLRAMSGDDD